MLKTDDRRLQTYRRLKGLTGFQLGQAIGYSEKMISNFETGRCKPNRYVMQKLALALEVPIEAIWPEGRSS